MTGKLTSNIGDILDVFSISAGFNPYEISRDVNIEIDSYNSLTTSITKEVPEYFFFQNIGTVLAQIVFAGGIIFAVLMLYASFLWMTAQGNEEKVSRAKKIFITSIVGVFILTSAAAIAYTVIVYLSGGKDITPGFKLSSEDMMG